ncbi:hypothetical protein [Aeromonas sp. R2-3]|uniref:hypothetical protein n=1 Tax=Aeromonas sp. R2-3 TaxID=3138461 RepID=UPI0034A13DF5
METSIYAGFTFCVVQPTEQHMQSIIKDRVSAKLYEMADPANSKNANSRVKALAALAELHGHYQPMSFAMPTLEQLNAAIASHQGQ